MLCSVQEERVHWVAIVSLFTEAAISDRWNCISGVNIQTVHDLISPVVSAFWLLVMGVICGRSQCTARNLARGHAENWDFF
jgi:hypothetical protein